MAGTTTFAAPRRIAGVALVAHAMLVAALCGPMARPGSAAGGDDATAAFSASELRTLRSLWLGSLGPPPDDPSNAYDTDPRAARLGRRIFFDTRFSANQRVACGTCHVPALSFQDAKPRAEGIGRLRRRSMPLLGVAHNTWFFWDGRKDSLWSQALDPLENPLEHGISRAQVSALVARYYETEYREIFGALPTLPSDLSPKARPAADDPAAQAAWQSLAASDRDAINRVYVNVGKAIAAFVRTIQPGPSRFDRYVEAVLAGRSEPRGILQSAEIRGLRTFIGKGKCTNCHAGPMLSNGEFQFTQVPQREPDSGRAEGIAKVLADEFNCLGQYSDAKPEQCTALRFIDPDARELMRAFKTPTLRNVAVRGPYMNAGQFSTLAEVLRFYRNDVRGVRELAHGGLTEPELSDLEAFLRTLTGAVTALEESSAAGGASVPRAGVSRATVRTR